MRSKHIVGAVWTLASLGWLMAGAAAISAVIASAVRSERLRNRVDSITTEVARHEEQLRTVRKDLHDIRNAVLVIQALSERDNE